ncbi:hypothetical protein LPJGGPFB_05654 [Ensifer adhaerens]|nr:hypothetical protein [Ensifer adhaerens]
MGNVSRAGKLMFATVANNSFPDSLPVLRVKGL